MHLPPMTWQSNEIAYTTSKLGPRLPHERPNRSNCIKISPAPAFKFKTVRKTRCTTAVLEKTDLQPKALHRLRTKWRLDHSGILGMNIQLTELERHSPVGIVFVP